MQKKILSVDDSSTVVMMERMILAAERFEIVTASNGQEGCERAKASGCNDYVYAADLHAARGPSGV